MKFRVYLTLLRPRTLCLRLWMSLFYCVMLSQLRQWTELHANRFLWLLLMLPVAFGLETARAAQIGVQPFRAVLPDVRRILLRQHLLLLMPAALLFGSLGAWATPLLPWPTAICIAFLGLTLMLPLDSSWRWCGSRLLTAAVLGLAILAMIYAATTRSLVQHHPWLSAIGSLSAAAICCRLSFPRERCGEQPVRRIEPLEVLDPQALARLTREQIARSKRSGRRWTVSRVRSHRDWIRAVLHEAYGFRFGWLGQLVIIPIVCVTSYAAGATAPYLMVPKQHSGSLADLLYAGLCDPGRVGTHIDAPPFLLLLPFALVGASVALPRTERPHPISRERRARLTFAASILQGTVLTVLIVASFSAFAWGVAVWVDAPLQLAAFFTAILAPLPLLPWVYWLRLYAGVRPRDRSMHLLLIFGTILVSVLAVVIIPRLLDWKLSPISLGLFALATLSSVLLYRQALLRFYRRGDLLQPSSRRHNLSLV